MTGACTSRSPTDSSAEIAPRRKQCSDKSPSSSKKNGRGASLKAGSSCAISRWTSKHKRPRRENVKRKTLKNNGRKTEYGRARALCSVGVWCYAGAAESPATASPRRTDRTSGSWFHTETEGRYGANIARRRRSDEDVGPAPGRRSLRHSSQNRGDRRIICSRARHANLADQNTARVSALGRAGSGT